MKIGMIGLGRMGAKMVGRLLAGGHECVVYDRNPECVKLLEGKGAIASYSLEALVEHLEKRRILWLMLPAGDETETVIKELADQVTEGDVILDGGNAHYKDDIKRSKWLAKKKIAFVDVGTSGGVWGLENGYSLTIGGERDIVKWLEPIFKTLAPGMSRNVLNVGHAKLSSTAEEGYLHCGPAGRGPFH